MVFTITGKHMEITDAIRQYAEKKAGKLTKFSDRIQEISVVMGKRDHEYEVEIIVDIEHNHPVLAKNSATDLYACIDLTVDKVERQMSDLHKMLKNRKHQS